MNLLQRGGPIFVGDSVLDVVEAKKTPKTAHAQ
jgi:hypothetical protein